MQADRFVSIGTYLPSAMLVSVSFSIMAIGLWIRSGRSETGQRKVGSTEKSEKQKEPEMETVKQGGTTAIMPKASVAVVERHLFLPITLVALAHLLGVVPLYVFNNATQQVIVVAKPTCPYCPITDFLRVDPFFLTSQLCSHQHAPPAVTG